MKIQNYCLNITPKDTAVESAKKKKNLYILIAHNDSRIITENTNFDLQFHHVQWLHESVQIPG